ncbi:MAG: hypothetical protein H6837_04575 [Planctomycetes bacterium]|nr:hypothetical protein [Planctomycetota bacterium]
MFKQTLLAASAAALLAVPAFAQNTVYVPDNAVSGGCNVIPFGLSTLSTTWANQHYQTMATLADLGNPTAPIEVCNIGFLHCGTGDFITHHDTIVVQMGQTTATGLSSTFAANLVSNVQVVLKCSDFQWKSTGGVWSRLGLDSNYKLDPKLGNLVVDICVTGNKQVLGTTSGFYTGARQRLYNFGWTASTGCPTTGTIGSSAALKWCIDIGAWSTSEHGLGCQGLDLSFSGSADLGNTIAWTASGQPSTAACGWVFGLRCFNPGIDLWGNGCRVYCDPLVYGAGAGFRVQVPQDKGLICQRFCLQFYCTDSSYKGGIATSDRGLLITGLPQ